MLIFRKLHAFYLHPILSMFQSILFYTFILCLWPTIIFFYLCFTIYRKMIDKILSNKLKNKYGGLVQVSDAVFLIKDTTKFTITSVLIVKSNRTRDLMEIVQNRLKNKVFNNPNRYPKLTSGLYEFAGYGYWIKNDYFLEDCLKCLPIKSDIVFDEDNLKTLVGNISGSPYPKNDKGLWEILVSNRPLMNYKKDNFYYYPIITRFNHVIADGTSLIALLIDIIGDSKAQNYIAKLPKEKPRSMLKNIKLILYIMTVGLGKTFKLSQTRQPDQNALHGPSHSGQKIAVWQTEESKKMIPIIKNIKNSITGIKFSHVLMAAVSVGITNYFKRDDRIFAPAPDVTRRMGSTTTLSKPEPPGSPPYYRSTSASSSNSASSRGGIDLTARHWWIIAIVLLLAAAVGVGVPIALKVSAGASFEERLEEASRLLQETPLIDGHNDLPWNIRKFMHNKLRNFKFDTDLREVSPWSTSAWSHTDLVRLERGHVAAQFWAAYVPCDSQHKDAVQLTLEQIDVIRRFTEWYHPRLVLCTSSEDIKSAHKKHHMCSLIGVEGGHSLAGSLAVLRTLYHVGVRYLTLTSTCNTPWADCSHVDMPGKKPEHGGLTNFGKAVIKEMNRLGMIVDLSHVSTGTMRDALEVSKAPVIFSHSSAHALCNSTRNVPDETLRKLALNGGIVMVNFYSLFLTCRDTSTVADAVAHINHIREIAGVDNVGLGAGYDGINYVPQGLEDVSSYPNLFAELIGTGKWTADDLRKLAGLNFLRVMQHVEKIRDEFKRANVPPYEDVMPRQKGTNNCTSQANY